MTRRVIAALALAAAGAARADLLIEAGGAERRGRLEAITADAVRFREPGGAAVALPRDAVARVELYRDLGGPPGETAGALGDLELTRALAAVAGPADYPDAGAVNLLLDTVATFEADGSLVTEVRNIVRVLRERGKGEGTVRVPWMPDTDSVEVIHGRTILPGGAVRRMTEKGTRVSPRYGGLPEYDRLKVTLMTLPAVDVGSVVDWAYRHTERPAPGDPVWFKHTFHLSEPVVRGRVELKIHKDAAVDVVVTGTDRVARSRRLEGDYAVETFEYRGLEPGPREDRRPPPAEIYPTVYAAPRAAWAEVAAAARPAFQAAALPGPGAAALVAELTAKPGTPEEVFRRISGWVAREVRLVGVGLGNFSYHPRALEAVLKTRTGNFLDKTLAFYGLLRAAGFPAELYLLADRYRAAPPAGLASLRVFNDAAVKVRLGGAAVWRDADEEELGPGTLPAAFAGAPALRVLGGAAAAALEAVDPPDLAGDAAAVRFRCALAPDGALEGVRELTVRGNSATTVRGYRNLSAEQLEKRMVQLNHAFHPRAELVGFDLEHVADFEKDVLYRRRFRVPGYALRAGGRVLAFRMPGLTDSAADVGLPVRRAPLAFLDRDLRRTEIRVELPAGFRVAHLPAGLEAAGAGYAYTARFEDAGGAVVFAAEYRREAFRIPPDEYPRYKRMRDDRARLARQWVVVEMVE